MNLLKSMENNEIFSQSELIIRNFVLNQKENIINLTVNDIASINYVSKSTLTRFAQKLHFAGWNEFKIQFLKEMDIVNNSIHTVDFNFPFAEKDSAIFVANKLSAMKKDTLNNTLVMLDAKQLTSALQLLCTQQNIHILGEGYSLLASDDFCFRMTRIGRYVSNKAAIGICYIAKTLTKKDLAIIVSYSGKTANVVRATHILRKNRVPIISITSKEDNPISELSNVALYLPTQENLYAKIGNFATVDAMRYLFDILFSIYFNTNYTSNLDKRMSLAKIVDKKLTD